MKKLLLILLCLPLLFNSCSKTKNKSVYKGYITNPDSDDMLSFIVGATMSADEVILIPSVDIHMISVLVNRHETYYDEYHFYDIFKNKFGKTQIDMENGKPLFRLIINKDIFNHFQKYDHYATNLFEDEIGAKLEECININGFQNSRNNEVFNDQSKDGKPSLYLDMSPQAIQSNFNKGPNTANVLCDCSEITHNNLSFTPYDSQSISKESKGKLDPQENKRERRSPFSIKYIWIILGVGIVIKFLKSKL
tara:strand:- start:271 stop:1020 length:750 start_codon:yes stop_codon:yes gene_type:complete